MPLTQLLVSYLIIQHKSIELWGAYVEILVWVNLLILIGGFGNRDYLLKKFSLNPSNTINDWIENVCSRVVILAALILSSLLFPVFQDALFIVILWIIMQFVSQSFQVLILFQKHFKFSVITELIANGFMVLAVLLNLQSLRLFDLLSIALITQTLKATIYFIFYFKDIKQGRFSFSPGILKHSIPYFIPLLLGTVRVKIDTYYANHFFNHTDLAKYNVLINFLTLGHVACTFLINPYLKAFFRIKKSVVKKIQWQSLVFGISYGIVFTISIFLILKHLYNLTFDMPKYIASLIFIVPLLLQMLIVNQLFRYNKQRIVSTIAFFVVLAQAISGYFLVKNNGIDGAIWLKAAGQWIITLVLWYWFNKTLPQKSIE